MKNSNLDENQKLVKQWSANSRASQLQKLYVTPELKVAKWFGATLFDYDYSTNNSNNILTYHINLSNLEDIYYINYRLLELAVNIDPLYGNIFLQVSYKLMDSYTITNKYIAISELASNGKIIYNTITINTDEDNLLDYLKEIELPCIMEINVVNSPIAAGLQTCSSEEYDLLQYQLYNINKDGFINNKIIDDDSISKYSKSLFTFVNIFNDKPAVFRFISKYKSMVKYLIYRISKIID